MQTTDHAILQYVASSLLYSGIMVSGSVPRHVNAIAGAAFGVVVEVAL